MKISPLSRILALVTSVFLLHSTLAENTSTRSPTFIVKEGAFPWYDRVNIWQLTQVPELVLGNGPLSQQSCSSHCIDVPSGTKFVVFAVSSSDVDKLKSLLPAVQDTSSLLGVAHPDGTGSLTYMVFTLASPPAKIGDSSFQSGVILLQIGEKAVSETTNTNSIVTNTPVSSSAAQTATTPSDPSKFELFLLVGQSNMAGRAPVQPEDKLADPNILILDHNNHWVTRGEPIHFDKPAAGVGPGYTFGKLLAAKKPGVTIGLIPCAFGGTSLAQWDPKSSDTKLYPPYSLYANAIRRAQIAMKSGTLKGLLWHQGESDGDIEKNAAIYATLLSRLVSNFRADLHAPNVPFIAGEIGYFGYATHPAFQTVNRQIDTLPTLIPFCAIASAKDLADKGDHLHFNNAAQKEMGQRYFDAFKQVEKATP